MDMTSIKTILAIVAALTLNPSAYAGGTPKGKPFVQLGNQIIELQGQMEQTIAEQAEQLTTVAITAEKVATLEGTVLSLEDRVLSLEDRVETAEANLSLLNTKATNQQDQINELINGALAHGVDILALQNNLVTINQQIATLETQTGDHAAEIAALQFQATSLTAQIETNAAGLTALQAELVKTNDLIEALEAELALLETVLEAKQNVINHTCEVGQALVEVQGDSVVCGSVGGASGLTMETVSKQYTFAPNTSTNYTCPVGSTIVSGAFLKVSGRNMAVSIPGASNGWFFQPDGGGGSSVYLLYLQCITLLP